MQISPTTNNTCFLISSEIQIFRNIRDKLSWRNNASPEYQTSDPTPGLLTICSPYRFKRANIVRKEYPSRKHPFIKTFFIKKLMSNLIPVLKNVCHRFYSCFRLVYVLATRTMYKTAYRCKEEERRDIVDTVHVPQQ